MNNRRALLAYLAASGLAACSPRGQFGRADAEDAAGVQQLLVATLRVADPAPIAYGADRADSAQFAQLAVSIPPVHQTGHIEWPSGNNPDPQKHFALVGAQLLPDLEALAGAVREQAHGAQEAVLFVHGYNTNFAEGVYRQAQIAWDYDMKGPQIHFAWASAAHALAYTEDRDSALHARDGLVETLLRLLQHDQPKLAIVGHSMGGFLVMEALRQIALQGDRKILDRLANVVLISPDIDIDLFKMQARSLAPLPQPFTVAVAKNDRLLKISAGLSGGRQRLGTVDDLDLLGDLGILVIDLTEAGGSGGNHFLAGSSPTAIAVMRGFRNASPSMSVNVTFGPVRITLGNMGLSTSSG